MFKRLLSLILILTFLLIIACSNHSKNEFYSKDPEVLRLIVLANNQVQTTIDEINTEIAPYFHNVDSMIYDIQTDEGKKIAKKLSTEQYPAYFLFNSEKQIAEKHTFDDIFKVIVEEWEHLKQ